jgi:hypothetical protein
VIGRAGPGVVGWMGIRGRSIRAKSSFSMLGTVPFWVEGGGPFAALCDKDAVLLISAVDEGGDVRACETQF